MSETTETKSGARVAAGTAYDEGQSQAYDDLRFTTPSGRRIDAEERRMLHAALDELPPGARALEIGCGTGRFLLGVLERGFVADGLDASSYMLDECRKKIASAFPAARLTLGSANALPHDSDSYDLVYSMRLLNQLGSESVALATVREMLRVVRPGGLALIEFMSATRPRPRSRDVLLDPARVVALTAEIGSGVVWLRGAFFLGMTAYLRSPGIALAGVAGMDRLLSRAFPRRCSRCYLLVRKA